MSNTYTVKELKDIINESLKTKNEFKAKVGKNVESDDKTNNTKSYKDTEKKVGDVDGKLKQEDDSVAYNDPQSTDYNHSTLASRFDGPVDKKYKERIKSQVLGKDSEINDDKDHVGDTSGNEKFYKQIEDKTKEIEGYRTQIKASGLAGREMDKKDFKTNTIFTESNHIKTLNFKNIFLNEEHMMSKIPDNFKTSGNKFYMKDSVDNKYLIEWANDGANVLLHEDKSEVKKDLNRINELFNYKSKDFFNKTTTTGRLSEETKVKELLDKTRTINDK